MEDIVDLILRVRSGDSLAFEELCEKYKPLIDSMARRFADTSTDKDSYDDLLQESKMSFYKAILNYDLSQSAVTFGLYVKTCIRNRLISYARKASSKKRRKMEENTSASQDSMPQEEVVEYELKKEFLSLAEDLLSNYEMKVFKLYISGLRAKEISARLGKSEKSVNNAIFRMRSKIRKKIKEDT